MTLKVGQLGELTIAAQRAAIAAVSGKKDKFFPEVAQELVDDYSQLNSFFGEALDRYLDSRRQIANFFRSTSELTLQLPALPRPTLEMLQKKRSWIKRVECDNSVTEAAILELGTVLCSDEPSINDSEFECRVSASSNFGFQQVQWLVDHQDEAELVAFKALCGKAYILFPGLKIVDADGYRRIPYLSSDGGRWDVGFDWVGGGFGRGGRLARPRK